jgi:hypothetical protein
MKEFFEELSYMCSSSNTKSRGLYIFIAIAMAIMAIGAVVMAVMFIVNTIKYGFTPLFLILLLVDVVLLVGVIIWLKKS